MKATSFGNGSRCCGGAGSGEKEQVQAPVHVQVSVDYTLASKAEARGFCFFCDSASNNQPRLCCCSIETGSISIFSGNGEIFAQFALVVWLLALLMVCAVDFEGFNPI